MFRSLVIHVIVFMKSTDIAEKIITRNLQKDFLKAHGVAKFHKENDILKQVGGMPIHCFII